MTPWSGLDVLVTGHTGFQGSWLTLWLHGLGARVHGFALAPPTRPSLFEEARVEPLLASHTVADVRDMDAVQSAIHRAKPALVFHLAAQPLVRTGYEDPAGTLATNIMGTVNVMEAVRQASGVRGCLVYTSDKCYENREWEHAYRESDALGGHDPYSASKGATEIVASSYRRSFLAATGTQVSTVRAGNVIGGGDWAADRIVPDAMKAFAACQPLRVRNPAAVRPWQHVLDPLQGCLMLALRHLAGDVRSAGAFNLGPVPAGHRTVEQLARGLAARWPGSQVEINPDPKAPHEAGLLRLDASKAHQVLGWSPSLGFEEALDATATWYHDRESRGFDARAAVLTQIHRLDAAVKGSP